MKAATGTNRARSGHARSRPSAGNQVRIGRARGLLWRAAMRSVRIALLSLSLAGALPVLGCNAAEPSALPDNYSQMPDMKKPPGAGDNADLLPPDDGRVDPPRLDAPIRLTEWLSVPVNGTAEAGTNVLIEGTASGTISAEVSTDGRFCANVKLRADAVNA